MIALLSLLFIVTFSNNYIVGDINVTISLISNGTLINATSTNKCNILQVRNMGLYHFNKNDYVYERWAKGSLETVVDIQNIGASVSTSFHVD